jgi:hydroxymethylpyrimidine pyrophosphatase-like HAD family hydrolase
LNRCQKQGIKIVYATARPKRTVNHFALFENAFADALILHNGAVVYIGNKLHTSFGIDAKTRDSILLSVSRDFPEATLSVEIEDVLYANFDVSEIWNNTPAVRTDFTDLPNKISDKIIIGSPVPLDMELLAKYIPSELYIETSSGENVSLELIMNRKATKWEAVKIVAACFEISAAKIVSFGDDYNDISMLKGCGVGVAVANAIDEAKAAANFICGTNNNDGVAKWLEENVL